MRDLERFLRVAAAIVGDRDVARDAVHEGFAAAVRKRATYAGRGTVDAWVWQVVLNAVRNYRRDSTARAALEMRGDLIRGSENGDVEDARRLRAALAALPERQRLMVFLHYYADLDYTTIAGALGVKTGTVGATLNAARATLRDTLRERSMHE